MSLSQAIQISPNTDYLAEQLRPYIIQRQDNALKQRNKFRIAVSGGTLPTLLAKSLLVAPESGVQFSKWEIFFADERLVPLNHELSNYKLLKDDLLDKIPSKMGSPKIHTIDEHFIDEDSGRKIAELYQERIRQTFGDQSITNVPIFDLILLGCGPDGHTCSLFPGHDLLREEKAWVAPETNSPKPPSRRISLTLPVVTAASAICFIAPREESDGALKHVFTAQGDKPLPAGVVNQLGQEKVSWFTDPAAMEGVNVQ